MVLLILSTVKNIDISMSIYVYDHSRKTFLIRMIGQSGGKSKYVTCFDSNYQTSKYVYDDISDNIEDLIEDALSNKAPQ